MPLCQPSRATDPGRGGTGWTCFEEHCSSDLAALQCCGVRDFTKFPVEFQVNAWAEEGGGGNNNANASDNSMVAEAVRPAVQEELQVDDQEEDKDEVEEEETQPAEQPRRSGRKRQERVQSDDDSDVIQPRAV